MSLIKKKYVIPSIQYEYTLTKFRICSTLHRIDCVSFYILYSLLILRMIEHAKRWWLYGESSIFDGLFLVVAFAVYLTGAHLWKKVNIYIGAFLLNIFNLTFFHLLDTKKPFEWWWKWTGNLSSENENNEKKYILIKMKKRNLEK